MKIIFFAISLMISQLFSRENFTLSNFGDQIYLLNGFDKELKIFDMNLTLQKKISLKNISQSGFFDFFIRYDPFRSYIVDSESGNIFLLDENLALKKRLEIEKSHGIRIYRKVFPIDYNSLLIASYEKDKIYTLENNFLKERLSCDDGFIDIYADRNGLYILFEKMISVYSPEGIFKNNIIIDKTKNYESIYPTISGIFIKSPNEVTEFSFSSKKFKHLKYDGSSVFTAIDSLFYYFSEDSLKLKAIKL
ncbi:MAG: hypothetical protein KKD38_05230 [Candidatus Delongbacteria bacterium]|nr:hypothetical protein [Candidatus Delongbacteria bacterium]MCG2761197.1 hypothetical protein [Candidatus Delongbacteria bacterium]